MHACICVCSHMCDAHVGECVLSLFIFIYKGKEYHICPCLLWFSHDSLVLFWSRVSSNKQFMLYVVTVQLVQGMSLGKLTAS